VFYLKQGDQLTCSAKDWLNRERIRILPAEKIRKTQEKPEHMTHLNSETLVSKTHPRILFRGKLDTLEAELILCQLADPDLVSPVGEILALTRRIIRCDVLEEPLKSEKLCGLTENEQRQRSHRPQEFYAQAHFMPEYTDGIEIARLNRSRCAAREAELKAVAAFRDVDGKPTRPDILQAMNRMSSMLYILMIRMKSKR
jgi:ethanolamine utilization cobalamin adenosyltransferase